MSLQYFGLTKKEVYLPSLPLSICEIPFTFPKASRMSLIPVAIGNQTKGVVKTLCFTDLQLTDYGENLEKRPEFQAQKQGISRKVPFPFLSCFRVPKSHPVLSYTEQIHGRSAN